jgi:regulator of sigma E protease
MSSFVQSVLGLIVTLGILVTVHEFGHYYIARRLKVKILRFSVGFGKPIWLRRFGADQTEFAVAAIPLGGYVKMLDEREGPVALAERARSFNQQTLWRRAAIVVAGPLANFLLAILAYWVIYVVGISGIKPLIGEIEPGSVAARAGLEPQMEIVEVAGRATPTWEAVLHRSIGRILDSDQLPLTLRTPTGETLTTAISLADINVDDVSRGNLFEKLGMAPYSPTLPAVIGEVLSGTPAERAGLRAGDEVLRADGQDIGSWTDWVDYVRQRPGVAINVEIARDLDTLNVQITPESKQQGKETIGYIGAGVKPLEHLYAVERYSPLKALPKSFEQTYEVAAMTLQVLGKMLFGEASVKNLSGPISIAQYAGQSVSLGAEAFLTFMAIVSISLGVLNLLPIPLLDGGHLLYYLIEFVTGRPVSESVQAAGQQIGLFLLLGLMGLAFYNDIMRIL